MNDFMPEPFAIKKGPDPFTFKGLQEMLVSKCHVEGAVMLLVLGNKQGEVGFNPVGDAQNIATAVATVCNRELWETPATFMGKNTSLGAMFYSCFVQTLSHDQRDFLLKLLSGDVQAAPPLIKFNFPV